MLRRVTPAPALTLSTDLLAWLERGLDRLPASAGSAGRFSHRIRGLR